MTAQFFKMMSVPIGTLLLVSVSVLQIKAQQLKQSSLLLEGGFSTHGSGDYFGGAGNVSYEKNVNKFFSTRYQLGVTIHGGSAFGYTLTNGFARSVPMYFVTAGVQTAGLFVFHATGVQYQWLNIMAGPLVRYQLSGSPDSYQYYNTLTQYNPLLRDGYYVIREINPHVFTLGYRVVLESQWINTPNFSFGIQAGFQNDTNGDVLTNLGIVLSRKWNHTKASKLSTR